MDILRVLRGRKPGSERGDKKQAESEAESIKAKIVVDQSGGHATVSIPKEIFGGLEKEAVGHIISYQLLRPIMDDPFLAEGRNEGDWYIVDKIPIDKVEALKQAIVDHIRKPREGSV